MKNNIPKRIIAAILAVAALWSAHGCRKSETESSMTTYTSATEVTSAGIPETSAEPKEDLYSHLDDETLRKEFEACIKEKDLDSLTVDALWIIYNSIEKNYDLYREANKYLKLPSKQEFIKTEVIDCLRNNVSTIVTGGYLDLADRLGGAGACYYHGTGEIYIGINDISTPESVAKYLMHEYMGHANQYLSVSCFGELEDILIEGQATWRLELLSDEYLYDETALLYNGDNSLKFCSPSLPRYNALYKMYGILTLLADYSVFKQASAEESEKCVVDAISAGIGCDAGELIDQMNFIINNSRNFDMNEVVIQASIELDTFLMKIFTDRLKNSSDRDEFEENLLRFIKFEQQYLSRNISVDDDGNVTDRTEEVNAELQKAKKEVVDCCLENNVLDGYSEEDYYGLLKLATENDNKKIGITEITD